MFSSIQVVFLIDRTNLDFQKKRLSSKIYFSCLRLLTEFSAQIDGDSENLKWACKFYNSKCFKPDFSTKFFYEFSKTSLKAFEQELFDSCIFSSSFTENENEISKCNEDKCMEISKIAGNSYLNKFDNFSHSFILNKSFQEILLDYNWERFDVNSPIKLRNGNSKNEYNAKKSEIQDINLVIVFSKLPSSPCEISSFTGKKIILPQELFKSIFCDNTLSGFKERKLNVHMIDIDNFSTYSGLEYFKKDLKSLHGKIHSIDDIVHSNNLERSYIIDNEVISSNCFIEKNNQLVSRNDFYTKPSKFLKPSKPIKGRLPQPGPELIWEDSIGIGFLKIYLKVIGIQESSSKIWGTLTVHSFIRGNSFSILCAAASSSLLYICTADDPSFHVILSTLYQQNLIMILMSDCGLVMLAPWIAGVGCLGMITPANIANLPDNFIKEKCDLDLIKNDFDCQKLVTACIKSCLKQAPVVCKGGSKFSQAQIINSHVNKEWFPSSDAKFSVLPARKTRRHPILMERLQKKYRPQLLRPLSTSNLPAPTLIDVTQPSEAAGIANDDSISRSLDGVNNVPKKSTIALKSKQNVSNSRASNLVKQSKMVSAMNKVKEQNAEKEAQEATTKQRNLVIEEKIQKSLVIAGEMIKNISDPRNTDEIASVLIKIRRDSVHEVYLDAIAKTIINVVLLHLKNLNLTPTAEEIGNIMNRGVTVGSKQLVKSYQGEDLCRELKLQALLHLEVLWVLGYSPNYDASLDQSTISSSQKFGDDYVCEILQLLRTIVMKFDANALSEFLLEVVVPSYLFLGETLVEIFEELNHPLPDSLAPFSRNDVSPLKSQSSVASCSSQGMGSVDNSICVRTTRAAPKRLLKREPSNRQIIVQKTRKNTRTSKRIKDQTKSPKTKFSNTVCRNLFRNNNPVSKDKLKRHHTVHSIKVSSKLNKTPNKLDFDGKTVKRKLSELRTPEDRLKSRGRRRTPSTKNKDICSVPETPHNELCKTIYNKNRLKKSAGVTVILESPDIKNDSETRQTASSSRVLTRNRSFYSGAVSRNFEKGQRQVFASHFKSLEIPISKSKNSNNNFLFSEILKKNNTGSSSKIKNVSRSDFSKSPKRKLSSECRRLSFGLDAESTSESTLGKNILDCNSRSSLSSSLSNRASPRLKNICRNLKLETPLKNSEGEWNSQNQIESCLFKDICEEDRVNGHTSEEGIKFINQKVPISNSSKMSMSSPILHRTLGLRHTPVKMFKKRHLSGDFGDKLKSSLHEIKDNSSERGEHVKIVDDNSSSLNFSLKNSLTDCLTPSKKVHFNFGFTPKKINVTDTPKSILKTPRKTPDKTPNKITSAYKRTKVFSLPIKSNNLLTPNITKNNLYNGGKYSLQKPHQVFSAKPSQFEALLHSPIMTSLRKGSSKKEEPCRLGDQKVCDQSAPMSPLENSLKPIDPCSPDIWLRDMSNEFEITSSSQMFPKICEENKPSTVTHPFGSPEDVNKPVLNMQNKTKKCISPEKSLRNSQVELELTSPSKNRPNLAYVADISLNYYSKLNDKVMPSDEQSEQEEIENFLKENQFVAQSVKGDQAAESKANKRKMKERMDDEQSECLKEEIIYKPRRRLYLPSPRIENPEETDQIIKNELCDLKSPTRSKTLLKQSDLSHNKTESNQINFFHNSVGSNSESRVPKMNSPILKQIQLNSKSVHLLPEAVDQPITLRETDSGIFSVNSGVFSSSSGKACSGTMFACDDSSFGGLGIDSLLSSISTPNKAKYINVTEDCNQTQIACNSFTTNSAKAFSDVQKEPTPVKSDKNSEISTSLKLISNDPKTMLLCESLKNSMSANSTSSERSVNETSYYSETEESDFDLPESKALHFLCQESLFDSLNCNSEELKSKLEKLYSELEILETNKGTDEPNTKNIAKLISVDELFHVNDVNISENSQTNCKSDLKSIFSSDILRKNINKELNLDLEVSNGISSRKELFNHVLLNIFTPKADSKGCLGKYKSPQNFEGFCDKNDIKIFYESVFKTCNAKFDLLNDDKLLSGDEISNDEIFEKDTADKYNINSAIEKVCDETKLWTVNGETMEEKYNANGNYDLNSEVAIDAKHYKRSTENEQDASEQSTNKFNKLNSEAVERKYNSNVNSKSGSIETKYNSVNSENIEIEQYAYKSNNVNSDIIEMKHITNEYNILNRESTKVTSNVDVKQNDANSESIEIKQALNKNSNSEIVQNNVKSVTIETKNNQNQHNQENIDTKLNLKERNINSTEFLTQIITDMSTNVPAINICNSNKSAISFLEKNLLKATDELEVITNLNAVKDKESSVGENSEDKCLKKSNIREIHSSGEDDQVEIFEFPFTTPKRSNLRTKTKQIRYQSPSSYHNLFEAAKSCNLTSLISPRRSGRWRKKDVLANEAADTDSAEDVLITRLKTNHSIENKDELTPKKKSRKRKCSTTVNKIDDNSLNVLHSVIYHSDNNSSQFSPKRKLRNNRTAKNKTDNSLLDKVLGEIDNSDRSEDQCTPKRKVRKRKMYKTEKSSISNPSNKNSTFSNDIRKAKKSRSSSESEGEYSVVTKSPTVLRISKTSKSKTRRPFRKSKSQAISSIKAQTTYESDSDTEQ